MLAPTPRRFSISTNIGPIADPPRTKAYDIDIQPFALSIRPEALAILLKALGSEQAIALLGGKFICVVLRQQILDRIEIRQ